MSTHSNQAVLALQDALEALSAERDEIDARIGLMQETISAIQGEKRGRGRPPGSKNKVQAVGIRRGPGRPPGSKNKVQTAGKKRRGRPPGSKNKVRAASADAPKKTRNWSPEARAAAAERMRKAWKKRRRIAKAAEG